MHLLSPKAPSPTTMLPVPERYKRANEFLRAEIRRVKDLHAKELAEKDSMIQYLNEQIQRLEQQQQPKQPTRTLSKSSSSSLSTSNNKPTGNVRRSNSFSASTNSTAASQLRMAELASFSSSISYTTNSIDDGDESISSHNDVIHQSFLSIPPEPLTEGDEEAAAAAEEEEKEEPSQKDILSQTEAKVKQHNNGNRPDDDEEEKSSDQLPRRNHSLSTFVKSTSKRFVRRMSMKKKSPRPFFRRQLRRKGTPVPTITDMVTDLKEETTTAELARKTKEGMAPRDIHFHPDLYNQDEESRDSVPRLESLLLQRKASIYSINSSADWSIDPIPSDSPHRRPLQSKSSSSAWSMEALPSDSASAVSSSSSKPRRATIASTTVRVRALPRELSLDRIVSDEEDSEEEEEEEENDDIMPHLQSSNHNNNNNDDDDDDDEIIHTVEVVHCQHTVDACGRRGVYSGKLDLKTQLPHGQGSMSYPDGSRYSGSWEQGHWQGRGIHRDGKKGSVYHGYFVQDQKEGTGILKYSHDELTFEGRFKDDQIREGTMTDARTGSTHEGLFENGQCHGFGSHQYSNGVQFRGQFEQGARHGHGMILLPDGGYYTGDFQNDMAHGFGQSILEDGTVEHTGQWERGRAVVGHPQQPIYDA